MKHIILILIVLLFSPSAYGKDIQLFNTEVLGQSTKDSVKLLVDKKGDEIEPYMISTDIKCGKYYAASVYYPQKASFEEAKASVNKQFKKYENISASQRNENLANWRITDKRFAINIFKEEGVRVSYIQFQPSKEVFKRMLILQGADEEDFDEEECK
jgi:hypothetical protein